MSNQTAPTKGQHGELGQLAVGASELLGLNRKEYQDRLLARGGEIKKDFFEVLKKYSLPVNPFVTEVAKQAWFYPKGLNVPILEVQAGRIQKVIGIEPKWPEKAQNLLIPANPHSVDGIGLWPILSALGKHWDITDPRVRGYGEVISAICDAIDKSPDMAPLTNYRKGELDERYVRIHAEVLEVIVALEEAAEKAGYNCLTMPVNLGDWRTGNCYSPRNARWQMLNLPPGRLPIEPVAGWSLLIGIKGRLTAFEQLFCDFTGAEYNWDADGDWSSSLCASFDGGRLEFDANDADVASGSCGAFAGFPGVSELAA